MNRFFGLDSPVMSFLGRLADLIWLNLLTLLFCIPVITAGASLTAMHYVTIKLVKNEEGYITREFWKSFCTNFRQATIIWAVMLLVSAGLAGDYYIFAVMERIPKILMVAVFMLTFVLMCGGIYIFPVLSRFENSIRNTVKNAFLLSVMHFPKTLLMLVIYALPFVGAVFFFLQLVPVFFLLGISLPAFLCAFLYAGIFKKLEPEEQQAVL